MTVFSNIKIYEVDNRQVKNNDEYDCLIASHKDTDKVMIIFEDTGTSFNFTVDVKELIKAIQNATNH